MVTEPDRRAQSRRDGERTRERDLPTPKRASTDAALFGFSPPRVQTGMTIAVGPTSRLLGGPASAASRPQVLVPRLTPAQLRDLPAAVGPTARQRDARRASPQRSGLTAEANAKVDAGTQRLPVTRPTEPAEVRAPITAGGRGPSAAIPRDPAAATADQAAKPAAKPQLPIIAGPSDRTAPDTLEAMEQRMNPAVQASTRSPSKPPIQPAIQPLGESVRVAMPAAPAAIPAAPLQARPADVAVEAAAGSVDAARPAQDPLAASGPGPGPDKVKDKAVMTAAAAPEDKQPPPKSEKTPIIAEPGRDQPQPAEVAAPMTSPDGSEPSPSQLDLGETPHLPMGWIIGALFVLALLLTLWIANRAGVFGPASTALPPLEPPSTSAPPRMP
jgi:hypothetical protein